MMEGWIKIYPKIKDWRWYKDAGTMRVFLHLLLSASFKDTPYLKTIIKRGQVLTSISKLSQELDIPAITIRRKIDNLKSTGEIVCEGTSKWTIITICNYESYQGFLEIGEQANEQADEQADEQASEQTYKNKNIRNKEDIISKKKIVKEKGLEFPFTSETFLSTWRNLIQQPKWKGKTNSALQLSLNKLSKYDEAFAISLMEDAIERNWQGVVFDDTDEKYRQWKAGKEGRQPKDKNDVNALWNR